MRGDPPAGGARRQRGALIAPYAGRTRNVSALTLSSWNLKYNLDRQTDRQMSVFSQRSTWWIITAYEKNIEIVENNASFPKCVKAVYGGREQCPTSGRVHFQGAVECHGQQRATFFRSWLPGVHFEVAKNKDAVKKYCLKEDTAVGDKGVISNPEEYMTMDKGMMYLAEMSLEKDTDPTNEEYWDLVNMAIRKRPKLISMYATPAFRTAWNQTRRTWRALVLQARNEGETPEIKIPADSTNKDASDATQTPSSDEETSVR